jgi:hypothetical protein
MRAVDRESRSRTARPRRKVNIMALALLRRRRSKAALAEAAGLSVPLPEGAGAVAREIVDPMGSPMAGVDVTVTALDTHRVAARGTTDSADARSPRTSRKAHTTPL